MPFSADYSDSGLQLESARVASVKDMKGLIRGTWDHDILDELKPTEEEFTIEKPRNSVFVGTDFQKELEKRGINQIILTGVATNVCVESTARDAWQLDYRVMTVADATATFGQEFYEASMKNLMWFGGVATVEQVGGALSRLGE